MALVVPAMVLGLPLVDTAMSVARRFVERKAICSPDRDHIHHRLTRTLSDRNAVLVLYAVALTFGTAAVALSLLPIYLGMAVIVGVIVMTGMGLNRLKYLRRSYVVPDIHPIGQAGAKSTIAEYTSEMAPEGFSFAESNGDGGSSSTNLVARTTSPNRDLDEDVAIDSSGLLAPPTAS